MGGHEHERFATVSDNDCAGRIRYQYLSQFGDSEDLQVGLLHRMAMDIAGQCGHTLLKAHRLAWGWTVTEAVDAFHQMCRRENIKPRGLVARSWMDWEAGSRPNWDYQDLLSRLFHTSPVRLGWAADYTPAGAARGPAGSSPCPQARSFAGGTPGVKELIASDSRHGRALLPLPPDTRDFTGRAEQVGEVTPADRRGSREARGPRCRSSACRARPVSGRRRSRFMSPTGSAASSPTGSSTPICAGRTRAGRTRPTSWPGSSASSASTERTSPRASMNAHACTGRSWQAGACSWCSTTLPTRRRSARSCRGVLDARCW